MAQAQWMGWAPPPTQKPGKFDFLAPMLESYFKGKEQFNQRQDYQNITAPQRDTSFLSPGLRADLEANDLMPPARPPLQSRAYQGMAGQQALQNRMPPNAYQQSQIGVNNARAEALRNPPIKETPERANAKKMILIDLDERYADNKLSRPELGERVNKVEQFFRSPAGMQATPQQIEEFYLSLEPTVEKKKKLIDRLLGPKSDTKVSPNSLSNPQAGFGSGVMAMPKSSQSKYKKGQPIVGPDGKKYRVLEDSDDPLLEEI